MEIPDEDPLEIRPVADAVRREEFEPCSNMFPYADGEVLNDEVVIIHPSSSAGELEVFEPYTGIRFPGVFGDVDRWSEALNRYNNGLIFTDVEEIGEEREEDFALMQATSRA